MCLLHRFSFGTDTDGLGPRLSRSKKTTSEGTCEAFPNQFVVAVANKERREALDNIERVNYRGTLRVADED
eukprot:jgi/Botrbrau1/3889/Bobra.0183s0110.1